MTKDELEKIDRDEVLLIDIRSTAEVDSDPSPFPVLHIPMEKMVEEVESSRLPKGKKIVTICRSGGRCLMLNQFLKEHGYEADYLEGGLMGWSD